MVRAALAGMRELLRGAPVPAGPPPGLHAYDRAVGGRTSRMHLRVGRGGEGMLFVDVTDVLHLTPTATHLAWLALEEVADAPALASLRRRWRGAGSRTLRADLARMRALVDDLSAPTDGCRTCGQELASAPLFSVPSRAPHKADLALTYACNNRCPHCYNPPGRFDLASLDVDGWRRVLGALADAGVPHVIFTGGEPTLSPLLPDLVREAEALGLVAGLNTNGRRLADPAYARALADAGLDHVQITLESHRRDVHDAMVAARAFDQTVAGVRAALGAGLHVLTNTTLTRANSADVEDTVAFLADLGLRTFAMNGMIHAGGGTGHPDALAVDALAPLLFRARRRADELGLRMLWYTVTEHCAFSPFELELGAKRCNAGEYSICVEPNGDVLPCQSYYRPAGNLLRDGFEAVWESPLLRGFRERTRDPAGFGLPDACHDCPELAVCGGGCPLERDPEANVTGSACAGPRSSGASAQPLVHIGEHAC